MCWWAKVGVPSYASLTLTFFGAIVPFTLQNDESPETSDTHAAFKGQIFFHNTFEGKLPASDYPKVNVSVLIYPQTYSETHYFVSSTSRCSLCTRFSPLPGDGCATGTCRICFQFRCVVLRQFKGSAHRVAVLPLWPTWLLDHRDARELGYA